MHAHCNATLEFSRGCTVTRGNTYKMSKQKCTTDTTQYFFSNLVTDVWNSLPDFIVAASSLNDLKKRVNSADLSKFLTIV